MKTLALKTKFQYIFCLIITLGFCNFKDCRAQSSIDSIAFDFNKEYYPGIQFGRSFNAADFKVGLSLLTVFEIDTYEEYYRQNLYYDSTKSFIMENKGEYPFIPCISINHHFIRTPGYRKTISQSFEFFSYIPYMEDHCELIGIGVQVQHYNFKTLSVSPQIKILPPMLNFFIKRNFISGERLPFNIPKYEFGMEFYLNAFIELYRNPIGF